MSDHEVSPSVIDRVDEAKRASFRKMASLAFTVPVIASFSMAGLSINEAHAQSYASNTTNPGGFVPGTGTVIPR